MVQRVLDRDPDYAAACVALAETYFYEAVSMWTASPEAAAERLFELGHMAARLDDQERRARLCLAWGYWRGKGDLEMAKAPFEGAILPHPHALRHYCLKGFLTTSPGAFAEGLWVASAAHRRAPQLPERCLPSRVDRNSKR